MQNRDSRHDRDIAGKSVHDMCFDQVKWFSIVMALRDPSSIATSLPRYYVYARNTGKRHPLPTCWEVLVSSGGM